MNPLWPKADQFQRRIALADRDFGRAIAEYRSALEAGRKWAPAIAQDAIAKTLLRDGRLALPASAVMQKAAASGLTGKGRGDKIDDHDALIDMACLVLKGDRLKPASRIAARRAQNDAGASPESVEHRLRQKFRADKLFYLQFAEIRVHREILSSEADAAMRKLGRKPSPRELRFIERSAILEADIKAAYLVRSLLRRGGYEYATPINTPTSGQFCAI